MWRKRGSDGLSWKKQSTVETSGGATEIGEEEEVQSLLKNSPAPVLTDAAAKKKLLLGPKTEKEVEGGGAKP